MNGYVGIALTLVLLMLNALFVGSEFALISARRTQLEPKAQAGSRVAKMALSAMGQLSLMMAAAQLGITACSVILGAVSEPAIAHLIEPVLDGLGVSEQFVHPIAFVIAITLVVFLHVVFGEMVPKNLALVGPDKAALWLGPFMLIVVKILRPFVVSLNVIANSAVRLVGVEPRDEVATAFSHDEVAGLVEESRREGLLDEDEYGLVSGALDFTAGTVEDVLLPRADLVTVTPTTTYAQAEDMCAATGFSRFPVEDPDGDLVGYVHIKDLLSNRGDDRGARIAEKWLHHLVTVAEGTGLFEALRAMQSRGVHIAQVIRAADPGAAEASVIGVIMLEDVLEEIVGEVHDLGR